MATYTITTPVNIDSLAAKVGSDIYNINGGYLTVDQHTRYGTNQNTSAAMGNITLSATLGGTVEFNSTKVRLIPYNTGSGVVPAYDTTISQGGASGILLGVYSSLTTAPVTVGAAMPSSGYILIRQWNSVSYTIGALTGIGATATDVDGPGWLEIVGVDASTVTVSRLNLFKVRGDYYDFLGVTTSGNKSTTYQIPSNGTLVYCGGVEVETAVGSGIYEFFPNAGSRTALLANIATDSARGSWCWISTAGEITFGNDGTNSTGAYTPSAGRKLRIPNIFFTCCTSASKTVNSVPHATLATRCEFAVTGGGNVDIDTANVNWWLNLNQPFSVDLNNVSTFTNVTLTECASAFTLNNVGIGQEAANSQFGLVMNYNFAGGTMSNCTWTRATLASSGNYIVSMTDCTNLTTTNEKSLSLIKSANASSGTATITRVTNSTWTDCVFGGGGRTVLTTCTNVTFTNTGYFDNISSITLATIPMYMFEIGTVTTQFTVDGVHFCGLKLVQPYNGIVSIGAAGCADIKIRNIGTYNDPVDLGDVRQDQVAWSRVTTTATVTKVGHGLVVGSRFYVPVSSVVAAITVGAKTVLATPTADTFTFACLNAGATSGTISYFPTVCSNFVVLASSAAANRVKIQRCYVPHTATNLFTGDNSSKNITIENVISDYLNPFLTPMLNLSMRGVSGLPPLTAQVACYGTHWLDTFSADVTQNLSSQSWSRVTTVCTVTSVDHKLRTGHFINVNVSSNTAAIALGIKTITVLDSDTFTFTCVNSGSTSGTITFRTVIDKISILMNEATADTSSQYTDIVGTTSFTSAGTLVMPAVNDSITFVMPDYLLGHTSFPIQEAVMVGGTISNFKLEYAIDNGSGFGGWNNLYYTRAGGSGSNGATTFTVTDATGVAVGDYVWGTNIGGNAVVTNVSSNTITVDNPNIGTVSGVIRFNHLRSETGIVSTGFKLKVKITTTTANVQGISSLTIFTDTDNTSRALQYPLDTVSASLYLYGMEVGTEVRVYRTSDDFAIAGVESTIGDDFTYNYTWSGVDEDVYIVVFSLTAQPIKFTNQILGANGLTIPVLPVIDRQYNNPA